MEVSQLQNCKNCQFVTAFWSTRSMKTLALFVQESANFWKTIVGDRLNLCKVKPSLWNTSNFLMGQHSWKIIKSLVNGGESFENDSMMQLSNSTNQIPLEVGDEYNLILNCARFYISIWAPQCTTKTTKHWKG